jgi:hypothetical protein
MVFNNVEPVSLHSGTAYKSSICRELCNIHELNLHFTFCLICLVKAGKVKNLQVNSGISENLPVVDVNFNSPKPGMRLVYLVSAICLPSNFTTVIITYLSCFFVT